ncbi:hypothetical protein GYMLUDRAFT_58131 [Collybiopsis luxurians FD-317 M1]|uniref:Uncharacterized protein n=1 Tax=Collybiopsis luxurians FD-317 M1 TaxID=944289 RepID=A0A0D0C2J5_9AGAR|nr:hypothetical protein GYMLUDRAFT_58131 [Collybiopsis luxurians FD-317 M1]
MLAVSHPEGRSLFLYAIHLSQALLCKGGNDYITLAIKQGILKAVYHITQHLPLLPDSHHPYMQLIDVIANSTIYPCVLKCMDGALSCRLLNSICVPERGDELKVYNCLVLRGSSLCSNEECKTNVLEKMYQCSGSHNGPCPLPSDKEYKIAAEIMKQVLMDVQPRLDEVMQAEPFVSLPLLQMSFGEPKISAVTVQEGQNAFPDAD